MQKKTTATVISQQMIADGIHDLWLKTDLAMYAHAGQFVGVYTSDVSKLLPRPISICEISDDFKAMRLVYRVSGENAGTADISKLKENDTVSIIGILGNGYEFVKIFGEDLSGANDVVIMGGGIGIPPILQLSKELYAHGIKHTVIAGYRNGDLYLNQDLANYGTLEIATEDGSVGTRGNVLDVVREKGIKTGVILACGPLPMLKAIKKYAETSNNNREVKAFISLEERMACGVGACLGCVCKTVHKDTHSNVNNARICTDGPVFDCREVMI
ncbi:MAG: dihydroorotate dehydrogenase electron transfer subunit [Lachnospiraceae bacterium]|nr:dihydroorotate dehydrogenase electron transfer subunit [Lachnospiraceae bacterium]